MESFLANLSQIRTKQNLHPTKLNPNNTDSPCVICKEAFEDECIRHPQIEAQWHPACFKCSVCGLAIASDPSEAFCDVHSLQIFCKQHSLVGCVSGIEIVTKFQR